MEQNLLTPKTEIKELFQKHFNKLMQTYRITDYLLITNSNDGRCLIRGSPEKLAAMFFEELKGNSKLRQFVLWLFRDSGIIKLFESEVKKHDSK